MNSDHVRSMPFDKLNNRHLLGIPICGPEPKAPEPVAGITEVNMNEVFNGQRDARPQD